MTAFDMLLPPAGLLLLAIVLLLLRLRRGTAVVLLLLVVLATRAASRLLLGGLILAPAPTPHGPAPQANSSPQAISSTRATSTRAIPPRQAIPPPQAIIVLPGDAPGANNPGAVEPGLFTLDRLRTAAALQRQTSLPILVSSARSEDGLMRPAAAMARSLREDFQVPVRWEEDRSQNLWQSAADSTAMLREAGISRVYLVVDAWDERLAGSVFRRAGLEVTPAPVVRPNPLQFEWFTVLPSTSAWFDSAVAIRQWAGLACMAMPLCQRAVTPGPN